ncbi:aldehyde dehydrogenase family protein [bacterium]|nr:aldehyde dehydrogenase family protein [candidate division CSSED10-310 bacterium]
MKPILINNRWIQTENTITVKSPFSGEIIAEVSAASFEILENAVTSSYEAFQKYRHSNAYERSELLAALAERIKANEQEIAALITSESGKPIRESLSEVKRAEVTFRLASGEAIRMHGDVLPCDVHPAAGKRTALVKRFPIGPVTAITPFNFPLNLVAHKVAPALACGCTVILKPSSKTPLTALKLGELLLDCGLPSGVVNIVPCRAADADILTSDPRIAMISFTGSAEVGWQLKARSARKRTSLELGGNAAAIVESDADIEHAVNRCVIGGYAFAGQICISLQRLYIHKSIYENFMQRFVKAVSELKAGNPADPEIRIGPMIDTNAAVRVEKWITDAVKSGAILHTGGNRKENFLYPSILSKVSLSSPLFCEEVFAPVVIVYPYNTFDEALAAINNSRFGLQAGIFTSRWENIWTAFSELQVGGVVIQDVPTIRVDNYPYGGVKDSGTGREGVRYAMEEMTEYKALILPI